MKARQTTALIIVGLVLMVFPAILATDLWNAAFAQPCPGGPSCYPWGGEGPVAGTWSYASKANYLIRGSIQLALLLGVGAILAFKAAGREPARAFQQLAVVGLVAVGLLFLV